MAGRPDTPDVPLHLEPGSPATLAPVIPIQTARRRRNPSIASDEDTLQREVLADAVRSGRLDTADLFAMVRLGILTDEGGLLPCADPHRRINALDWEQHLLESDQEGLADHPSPSQVGCPIMAQAASAAVTPACVEALRRQAETPTWHPERGFLRLPVDPQDPVVLSGLRPCVLLGRVLLRHLLLPLWQKRPR
ncbi:MAG: hypothetical protein RMK29_06565 [Myxococcales bacterium]|nr:hypothetical protein [Myxococcota bacterium]MDW8281356.1 hypothetical protein [Myxococcales bacterium]